LFLFNKNLLLSIFYLGRITQAICQVVAELTRECVRKFLHELQATGRIMSSAESAEYGDA
jgi:hypothetical protein